MKNLTIKNQTVKNLIVRGLVALSLALTTNVAVAAQAHKPAKVAQATHQSRPPCRSRRA